MPYEPYATESYYLGTYQGTALEDAENVKKWLKQASRHIDSPDLQPDCRPGI